MKVLRKAEWPALLNLLISNCSVTKNGIEFMIIRWSMKDTEGHFPELRGFLPHSQNDKFMDPRCPIKLQTRRLHTVGIILLMQKSRCISLDSLVPSKKCSKRIGELKTCLLMSDREYFLFFSHTYCPTLLISMHKRISPSPIPFFSSPTLIKLKWINIYQILQNHHYLFFELSNFYLFGKA